MNRNKIGIGLLGVLSLLVFSACEKSLTVEGAAEGNSTLTVVTRSGEADAKVTYPVVVYVMNSSGRCVRKQELASADDKLALKLEATTYHVYAVAGVADESYVQPELDEATATSPFTLRAGATHADLMAADNTVTLGDNETSTLQLSLSRKVMEMQNVVMKNIPSSVTSVEVMFSPLYQDLQINGEYSEQTGPETMTLTRQEDGTTWKNSMEAYLLPADGNATITVKLTTDSKTTSYSYSCPKPLKANYHIDITGTYLGTGEFTLVGVISGATWEGTTTIEFTFDENDSQTVDNTGGGNDDPEEPTGEEGVEEGTAPSKNIWYKDCFAYMVADDPTGEYTIVTLIHKDEVAIDGSNKSMEELETAIAEELSSFEINDITGWRLPTEAEARAIERGRLNMDIVNHGGTTMGTGFYYLRESEEIRCFSGSRYDAHYGNGELLRPVTTLKFRK